MRKLSLAFFVAMFTMIFIVEKDSVIADHDHHHCISEHKLKYQFRKWEAFLIAQNNAGKVHRALDRVLSSAGPGDPAFEEGVGYVLSVQLDQDNMDVTIDNTHITNAQQFRAAWAGLADLFRYRKRNVTEWILDEQAYKDDDCLRQITLNAVGQNFNWLQNGTVSYSNDRFRLTLVEVPYEDGHNCSFNFRIKKIEQITEARFIFPAGTVAQVVSSPVDPNAPANYIPFPCPAP